MIERGRVARPLSRLWHTDVVRRVLVAAAVALLLVPATAGARGAALTRPGVRVLQLRPLSIVGHGFRARERLTIRLAAGVSLPVVRRLVATPVGTFRTTFVSVAVDRCEGYAVVVRGPTGAIRATLHVRPLCPPP